MPPVRELQPGSIARKANVPESLGRVDRVYMVTGVDGGQAECIVVLFEDGYKLRTGRKLEHFSIDELVVDPDQRVGENSIIPKDIKVVFDAAEVLRAAKN